MSVHPGLLPNSFQKMVISDVTLSSVINPVNEELVSMTKDIQAELLITIEKMLNLTQLMDDQATAARQQQAHYEEHIWPAVMHSHDQLNWVANAVRQGIDSCTITESKLSLLLAVNEFKVQIQSIVTYLTDTVHREIEQVLEFRQRGICGISHSKSLTETLEKYQKDLKMKILKL